MCGFCCCFFFFKQKTAYEMRISDWSSDVCSSDLPKGVKLRLLPALGLLLAATPAAAQCLLCAQDKTAGVAARGTETPLRVEVEARLDMGRVAVGAMGGEVEVDPVSGARRVRGDQIGRANV